MIRVTEVTKIYKGEYFETKALDSVSMQVAAGEFVAIMGESGSGKTTLLNILGGLDCASSGEVWIDNVNTQELKPAKLDKFRKEKISFVFQHFALMEEYSVYENLEAPLYARNIKHALRKQRIAETVEQLGISDIIYKFPGQISGGQKQRVAIARAVISDCPIILADEPTGALDEENTKTVMELLQKCHEMNKTLIVITHDQNVAAYADRVILLHDGRIM